MEIITYVLSGALEHKDSMGNGRIIQPGEFQYMAAGTGVQHSEFNPSPTEPVHFLQIWITPNVRAITPAYAEKRFDAAEKRGKLRLIAAPDTADGALLIHQDARIYAGLFAGDERATLDLAPDRRCYLHVARGEIRANDIVLQGGDGLKVTDAAALTLTDGKDAEVIVFDLPGGSH